jgi:hypothetical protein
VSFEGGRPSAANTEGKHVKTSSGEPAIDGERILETETASARQPREREGLDGVSAVGRKGCPNPRTEACSDDATRPPGALLEKPIENGNREETRDVLHGVPSGEN